MAMHQRTIMLEGTNVPLVADVYDDTWNGFWTPLLTRQEFADYLSACERNDPNGEWHQRPTEHVDEDGRRTMRLSFWEAPDDPESDDVWEAVEWVDTIGGGAVSAYAVHGLVWVDYIRPEDA